MKRNLIVISTLLALAVVTGCNFLGIAVGEPSPQEVRQQVYAEQTATAQAYQAPTVVAQPDHPVQPTAPVANATPAPAKIVWQDSTLFEATFNGFDLTHDTCYTVVPGGLWKEGDNSTTVIVITAPGVVLHLPGLPSNQAWKGHEWRMCGGYDSAEINHKPEEVKSGSHLDFTPSIILVSQDSDLDKPIKYGASGTRTLRQYGFTYKLHPTQR